MDKIYVITLDTSIDRQESFRKEFEGLDYEFFVVRRDSENPYRGNYNSHISVIRKAAENNYKTILIFEDDARLLVSMKQFKETINSLVFEEFIGTNDWYYIMLGYLPIKTRKFKNNLLKVDCAYDAHAYVVNVKNVINSEKFNSDWSDDFSSPYDYRFCNFLSEKEMLKKPVNYKFNDGGIYAIYPMLVKQSLDYSTLNKEHLNQDYFFKFYGHNNSAKISSNINTLHLGIIIFFVILFFICFSFFIFRMFYKRRKLVKW